MKTYTITQLPLTCFSDNAPQDLQGKAYQAINTIYTTAKLALGGVATFAWVVAVFYSFHFAEMLIHSAKGGM